MSTLGKTYNLMSFDNSNKLDWDTYNTQMYGQDSSVAINSVPTSTTSASHSLDFSKVDIPSLSAGVSIFSGLMNSMMQRKQNKAQAGLYDQQAVAYEKQSQWLMESASMSASQAKLAAKMGEANAREITKQAGKIDPQKQFQLQAVNQTRRAKIGMGKTAFASAGILLESRAGAAVAKWEQDEAADAALEKLNVMNQAEVSVYNHLVNAKQAKIQGYSQAANYAGQAAQIASEANNAYMESVRLKQLAEELRAKDTWGSVLGGIVQGICTVVGASYGGSVGAAIGSTVGSALNSGIQYSRM